MQTNKQKKRQEACSDFRFTHAQKTQHLVLTKQISTTSEIWALLLQLKQANSAQTLPLHVK